MRTTHKDRKRFLGKYFSQPLQNAAVAPSSEAAVELMFKDIDFNTIHSVVELGGGTGPYTAGLIKRCLPDARILVVELDPDYCKILREKFGDRITLVQDSVHDLDRILVEHDMERPDLLVSSLPFFVQHDHREPLASIRRLTKDGVIFRFEIIFLPWGLWVYRSLPIKALSFVKRNVPPMWIYGIN